MSSLSALTPDHRDAFADRIAARRTALGLSRRKLAEVVGGLPMSIRAYESGYQLPPADRLAQLAAALGVTVEWLVSGEDGS